MRKKIFVKPSTNNSKTKFFLTYNERLGKYAFGRSATLWEFMTRAEVATFLESHKDIFEYNKEQLEKWRVK